MSPYLFVLCVNKLSHIINDAMEDKKGGCMKAERNGPQISHLMFVDDLILFRKATKNKIQCVVEILHTFCVASG